MKIQMLLLLIVLKCTYLMYPLNFLLEEFQIKEEQKEYTSVLKRILRKRCTAIKPCVIIGSGVAGFTAGMYCARSGLGTVIITGDVYGGQLTQTSYVENMPGIKKNTGMDIMQTLQEQAEESGALVLDDKVIKVKFDEWPFLLHINSGQIIQALSVIIATGAAPRKLGITNELKFWGKGVTACALCDCMLFKNKKVVVVGGGDTALEEAMQLATYAKSVTVYVRAPKMRANHSMQNKLRDYENISIIYQKTIIEVLGNEHCMTGLKIQDTQTGIIENIEVDGLFLAIGHNPTTELFKDCLQLTNDGYIVLENNTQNTSIRGVFAAGDVADYEYRQAGVAAGDAIKAAISSVKWLRDEIGLTDAMARKLILHE